MTQLLKVLFSLAIMNLLFAIYATASMNDTQQYTDQINRFEVNTQNDVDSLYADKQQKTDNSDYTDDTGDSSISGSVMWDFLGNLAWPWISPSAFGDNTFMVGLAWTFNAMARVIELAIGIVIGLFIRGKVTIG